MTTVGINVMGWEFSTNPEDNQFQILKEQNKIFDIVGGGQTVQELVHGSSFWSLCPIINLVAGCAKLILGGMTMAEGNYKLGFALIGTGMLDMCYLSWPAHITCTIYQSYKTKSV